MAIALDSTTAASGATASSHTFSHTCTGSDLILFVTATGANGDVTGITYNSVAMTKINSTVTDSAVLFTSLWYLVNPSTGANNVVITTSTATGVVGSSASYTGVNQTGQPDASTTVASSTTTSYSSSVTSVANNCWTIATSRTGNGFALTAGANTVVRNQPESIRFGAGGVVGFWGGNYSSRVKHFKRNMYFTVFWRSYNGFV